MKTANLDRSMTLRVLAIIIAGLLTSQYLAAQGWYDTDWLYRSSVAVTNPGSTDLSDFQVKIALSTSDFEFAKTLSDGSDIRFTSSDGTTLIPFWIESWNYPTTATIWVKVPGIPTSGATVYVYYGNGSPTLPSTDPVETPPIGPFTKYSGNPITVTGLSCQNQVLPENLVYDGGKYWVLISNRCINPCPLSLISSTDLITWVHEGIILSDPVRYMDSPCIVKANNTWYIFYSNYIYPWSESNPAQIGIARSTTGNIMGPYEELNTSILACSTTPGTWDDARVSEPYVIQRDNGDWVIVYMGDATAAGGFEEQIGIAVSTTGIEGPYTKSSGNPVIPFGTTGSIDAGTVADPWVVKFGSTYYIGYTASPTKVNWNTTYATTTDWSTFTKSNTVILEKGGSGAWDALSAFRGAVTRVGDTYIFPYTGQNSSAFQFGYATQPVYQVINSSAIINNSEAVFEFYDGFDGTELNTTKWNILRQGVQTGTTSVSDGILTLRAITNASSDVITLTGNKLFGPGMLLESSARHSDANGSGTTAAEVGFGNPLRTDVVRIFDYNSTTSFIKQALSNNQGNVFDNLMAYGLNNNDYLLHRIFWRSSSQVDYALESTAFESITEYIPTISIPPWLMCAALPNQATLLVDWIRVRKWTGSDLVTTIGGEESINTMWTGSVSSDWETAGNWTSGVPADWSVVTIQGGANSPVLNGPLAIGSTASLTLDPGGSLTVNGDLNNSGMLTIGSTLTSSGSLIVNGASTGNITYNRQLKPGSDATRDWHLVSAPVQNNTETNATKISTVYQWSETTGAWNTTTITSSLPGHGYNIRQTAGSDGLISFTGSLVNDDVLFAATSPYADAIDPGDNYFTRAYVTGRSLENPGGGGWNLLGNPYASAILASEFIDANYNVTPSLSQFDPNYVALYLFDGTDRRYYYIGNPTGWPGGGELAEAHVQAGQAFFVLAMNDNSEFLFTRVMQEHSTGTDMLKSAGIPDRWPGLQLKVRYGTDESITTIVFNEKMTAGVDPGYDVGLFKSGQELEVYTTLVLKDNSVNFARQALPVSGTDTIILPVGIDSEEGVEVTFSADVEMLGNYKFWLEDRKSGIFTDLNSNNYTVTLPSKTYGTGRFFIIASTNTPTSVSQLGANDTGLRVWTSNEKLIIKGDVSENAWCEVYDVNGKKILDRRLSGGELNTVALPSHSNGIVIVRVIDGAKVTTRKVVLL